MNLEQFELLYIKKLAGEIGITYSLLILSQIPCHRRITEIAISNGWIFATTIDAPLEITEECL
jgi:hypothetical protein